MKETYSCGMVARLNDCRCALYNYCRLLIYIPIYMYIHCTVTLSQHNNS